MLFNKNNQGAVEVKELMGFTYVSIPFDNLVPYIEFAERDLIRQIVSKTLIETAQAHYDSANYKAAPAEAIENETEEQKTAREALNAKNALLDTLVKKIQNPIIRHALRMYFPSSDVQHTDSGRSITVTENQKPAFEWQVEKDNANMLVLAHIAEEMLIEFLFDNKDSDPLDTVWKDTEAAKALKGSLINSAEEFSKVFYINNSRRVFMAISPIMREKEHMIESCFLPSDFETLKTAIETGTLTADQKITLGKCIIPLAYYTMADALKQINIEMLPDGLFQSFYLNAVSSKAIAKSDDRIGLSVFIERKADIELKKLQEYLLKKSLTNSGIEYEPENLTDRMDPVNKFFRP